jgi:hypothetical protein
VCRHPAGAVSERHWFRVVGQCFRLAAKFWVSAWQRLDLSEVAQTDRIVGAALFILGLVSPG